MCLVSPILHTTPLAMHFSYFKCLSNPVKNVKSRQGFIPPWDPIYARMPEIAPKIFSL